MSNRSARVLLVGLVLVLSGAFAPQVTLAGSEVVAQAEQGHTGTGKINSIDAGSGKANITHGPIPSLGWPAMTMDFQVNDKAGLEKLKPGDAIEFKVEAPARGSYVITEIKPK